MSSLRRQLALSLGVGLLLAMGAAGALLHWRLSDALTTQFDAGLLARAQALRTHVEFEDGVVEFDEPEAMQAFAPGPDAEYFCMWLTGRDEVKRSPSLGDGLLPHDTGPADAPRRWDLTLPDGRAGRALGLALPLVDDEDDVPGGDDQGAAFDDTDARRPAAATDAPLMLSIVVAASRAPLDDNLAELLAGLGGAGLLALLFGAVILQRSLTRALEPVDRLARRLDALDAGKLDQRVGDEPLPDELRPVTSKLDELLARLEDAFARQRRMTGAMAHELRTPIAELRTASDVAARWPEDDGLVDELVATAGEVALRMSAAVEAVMHYCRMESGETRPRREPVALAALLDELWAAHAHHAREHGLDLDNAVPAECTLASDRELLTLVFGNLLSNAVSFASGGSVRTALHTGADAAWLVIDVSNHTDALAEHDLERLGEAFWRKDEARSAGEHSGLGLTLVSSVLEVLGGGVEFRLHEQRFVARVRLPVDGPPEARERATPRASGEITSP